MSRNRYNRSGPSPIYSFALAWAFMSILLPMYRTWALLVTLGVSSFVSYLVGRRAGKKAQAQTQKEREAAEEAARKRKEAQAKTAEPANYRRHENPEIDAIFKEGNRALSEMGRLYLSIKDPEIRQKINEIMRITDKIVQDAEADPSDIPQIKKFLNYYLPTTIKLLNTYDRMSAQGIRGENLDKSMKSITEMLDTAIEAYKKRLDSLFENQAMDIETDIQVMNTMLAREGLAGDKDFIVEEQS